MKTYNRRRGRAVVAAALFVAAALLTPEAFACDTCWGAKVDTPTTRGITMAMTALIGMTSIVGGGIGAFFMHVRRRSRLLEPGDLLVTEDGEIRKMEKGSDGDELY